MEIGGSGANRLISLFEDSVFSQDSPNEILVRIAEIGRELFQADLAVLFARTPTNGRFYPVPAVDGILSEAERRLLIPPRPEGLSQELVSARLMFVDELADASGAQYGSAFTRAAAIQSFAGATLPASGDQEPLGVLYLDYRAPHRFSDEEKAHLRGFADQAALVLRSRLSFDGLRRVRQTGERLTRALDSPDVLGDVVIAIRDAAEADLVVLYPSDPKTRSLLSPVLAGDLLDPAKPPTAEHAEISVPSRVLETGESLFLRDAPAVYDALRVPAEGDLPPFVTREQIRSLAALPLLVGDDQVGVLFVNYRRRQELDASQVEVVQSLSKYAAIAIRNSGVIKGLRDREVRRLELLRRIDCEISGTLDLSRVLQATIEESAREVGAEEASILRYDPEKDALDTVAAVGEHAERSRTQRLLLSEAPGITRWVFQKRVPVRVDDVRTDPLFAPLHVEVAPGIISEMDIPLLHNGDVLGVMNYESSHPAAFDETHQEFLVTLAEHAVLAILNADAYERERRTVRERSIMADVSKKIAGSAPLNEIFEIILDQALALTGATAGELMVARPGPGHLERVAGRGDFPDRSVQSTGEGIIGWVVSNRRAFVGDILSEPWCDIYRAERADTQAEMAVPLLSGDKVLGVLDVESAQPKQFGKHDLRLMEALADLAVVAIENANNKQQAEIQLRRFRVLHQAGLDLGAITEPDGGLDEAYEAIIKIAKEHTQGEVVIRRFEPATRELVARKWAHVQSGDPFASLSVDEPSLNAQVFRERQSFVVHDVGNLPPNVEAINVSDRNTRTLLITPIWSGNGTYFGNLALAHAEPNHFLDTDLELFEGLARLLALTIQRLETTSGLRDAEQRLAAAEAVTSMNLGAAQLAHRLSDELAHVPSKLRHLADAMQKAGILDDKLRASLQGAMKGTETVRGLGQSLREQADAFKTGSAGKTDVPLRAVLREIASAMPEEVPTGIRLSVDESLHEGVTLHVAPQQIVSIMRELVRNAIHAVGEKGEIVIRARATDETVEISCSDSGRGISPGTLKQIFLPFHSTKGSSGLGLWMGLLVARSAGGSLDVESELGIGTTFTLRLPRVTSSHRSRVRSR